ANLVRRTHAIVGNAETFDGRRPVQQAGRSSTRSDREQNAAHHGTTGVEMTCSGHESQRERQAGTVIRCGLRELEDPAAYLRLALRASTECDVLLEVGARFRPSIRSGAYQ